MLNGHLSDEEIQDLALNNNAPASEMVAHTESCQACKIKLQNYRMLINAVEQQPSPVFNFDLAAAVVSQIETPTVKTSTKGLWWLFAATMMIILVGVAIYFGEYMTSVYEGLKSLVIYLIAISVVVLAIMLAIDQYKTYQKKMKLLDMQ